MTILDMIYVFGVLFLMIWVRAKLRKHYLNRITARHELPDTTEMDIPESNRKEPL